MKQTSLTRKWLGSALLLAPLLVLCVQFVDEPVGLFVKEHLYANSQWSRLTSNLPDLLLVVVLVTTVTALTFYLLRAGKGIFDSITDFDRLVAWAAPVSYVTKDLLKSAFGRVNTRIWVSEPHLYGFYPFNRKSGFEGFPSGHMLVIVTILAAFWRFYPKSRPWCIAIGTVLAIALVLTNYHFVSDVLAGAYLGIAVEALVFRMLIQEKRGLDGSVI